MGQGDENDDDEESSSEEGESWITLRQLAHKLDHRHLEWKQRRKRALSKNTPRRRRRVKESITANDTLQPILFHKEDHTEEDGATALADFIQPEGDANNLPKDTTDTTLNLAYSELALFFYSLACELEDERLPDSKLSIAKLKKQALESHGPQDTARLVQEWYVVGWRVFVSCEKLRKMAHPHPLLFFYLKVTHSNTNCCWVSYGVVQISVVRLVGDWKVV